MPCRFYKDGTMTRCFILLFVTVILFFPVSDSVGEFYEFVDENGVRTFTDDPGIIPDSRHDDIQVHKEPYDDLTEEERENRLAAEQAEILAIQKDREKYRQRRERLLMIRQLEDEKIQKRKKLEASRTPVKISNNQILVPVTLSYLNNTVQTTLLLDTGANITTISESIAQKLSIDNGIKSSARVANGQVVKTSVAEINRIQVGPKTIKTPRVAIVPFVGKRNFDGLLGLDFLRHFGYDIDYQNSLIQWKE